MRVFDVVGLGLATVDEATVPPGAFVELPGRGRPFVVDIAGPPSADDRPPLFLVHGLIASAYLNWFPAFGPLSAHFRVLAMDLRGHGRGIPLGGRRFRFADCADDVAAVLDALGVATCIPVGYSLGGPVAQLLWRRHPDRVAGLVLAATSRNFMGTAQERLFFQSMVGVATAARTSRVLPWVGPPAVREHAPPDVVPGSRISSFALEEIRRTSPGTVVQAMSALGRFSSHEWIGQIDVPTAVVVTTKDRAIGPHRQLKLANAIPGATVHPAKAGHTACVLSARLFVPTLVEACLSVADRAASA
jgi:pimeloyl-ACP methyl ester carboxylesterase